MITKGKALSIGIIATCAAWTIFWGLKYHQDYWNIVLNDVGSWRDPGFIELVESMWAAKRLDLEMFVAGPVVLLGYFLFRRLHRRPRKNGGA